MGQTFVSKLIRTPVMCSKPKEELKFRCQSPPNQLRCWSGVLGWSWTSNNKSQTSKYSARAIADKAPWISSTCLIFIYFRKNIYYYNTICYLLLPHAPNSAAYITSPSFCSHLRITTPHSLIGCYIRVFSHNLVVIEFSLLPFYERFWFQLQIHC